MTEDKTDLYSRKHAAFYDAFHGTYVADHAFYLKMARKYPGPLLELACGTGRLGMSLIEAGVDYLGMDAAAGMLALFEGKWRKLGLKGSAPFRRGDMRSFRLDRKFRLILITFNSLQHIHRAGDIVKTLECCRRYLKPGGRLVFDIFNPSLQILGRDLSKRYPVQKFYDEAHGQWCELSESNRYDAASQVNHIQWFYRYEKGEEGMFRLEMRQIFPQEMDALLEAAGFKILNKWGDFSGSGFSSISPRQIFECSKV